MEYKFELIALIVISIGLTFSATYILKQKKNSAEYSNEFILYK